MTEPLRPRRPGFPFSRWREKVPKADEGGASESDFARPTATLTRRALRAGLSRQRERRLRSMERVALFFHTGTPWGQSIQRNVADARADQPQRRQSDRGGHAPHLAVAAFADRQLDPGVGHALAEAHRRVARPEPVRRCVEQRSPAPAASGRRSKVHLCAMCCNCFLARLAFDLHAVGLGGAVARVGQALARAPSSVSRSSPSLSKSSRPAG